MTCNLPCTYQTITFYKNKWHFYVLETHKLSHSHYQMLTKWIYLQTNTWLIVRASLPFEERVVSHVLTNADSCYMY